MRQTHQTNLDKELKMAEINKLKAETEKLKAEQAKIEKETKYYPWVIVVSASVAATITTLFALFQWAVNP